MISRGSHRIQTRGYDKLENNAKKRLARVDHLEYVNQLEATVAQDRGADYLDGMKSDPSQDLYYRKSYYKSYYKLLKALDEDAIIP